MTATFRPHVTNYAEREASRDLYLAYLERAEHARVGQPLPQLGDDKTPSKVARAKAAIRDSI